MCVCNSGLQFFVPRSIKCVVSGRVCLSNPTHSEPLYHNVSAQQRQINYIKDQKLLISYISTAYNIASSNQNHNLLFVEQMVIFLSRVLEIHLT